jgi:hypothetical protein
MRNDRAEVETLAIDGDVKAVLSYMQDNLPAHKLVAIATALPTMAKLLWERFPQESVTTITLGIKPKECSQSLSASSV